MSKGSKLARFYVKYIIKKPAFFYLFLCTGVILFIRMTLSLRLDTLQSFPAKCENGAVIIEADLSKAADKSIERMYLYRDRNDKVAVVRIESISALEGVTVFTVLQEDIPLLSDLSGDITAEAAAGTESLLERIFVKAGKQE